MQLHQFLGLQQAVDGAILGESWDKVKSLLEDYTTIFESALDPQLTRPLKCSFCLSSAELFFHGNNDLISSIDSLRRGYAFDNDNKHLRIVAMRIMLITCKSSINFFSSRHDPTQHYRYISYKGGDLSLASSLGDRQKEIPLEIVSKIDSILRYFTKIERCSIISILETFPISIIAEALKGYYHKLLSMGKPLTENDQKKDFVLSIAQYFIPQYTNIPEIYDLYMSGQITAYNYWAILDSILMRATIAEILGDLGTATTLLQLVVDFHGKLDLTVMEEHCVDQVLLCVSKLPLLYAKKGRPDLSVPLFHSCIYDDGLWSGYLPMKVRLGLSMKAALHSIETHGKIGESSGITRDIILRAGEYLAYIWNKLKLDKSAFIDALSQSSFSSKSLYSLKISGINVLPDDDTNISFIASNFDVSGVGVLLAALIHYSFLHLDMRLTPSIILSKDYEETFLSFDVHATMHEIIEWGYQLSLKPSIGAIWNMATSCLLHAEDPQRASELLYLAHQQVIKDIQHYLSEHEIKTIHLSSMETARLYIGALHHITSIEDHELGKGLTTLSFHIPQRYLEDPWASLVKYSEIIVSHVCAVTHSSYHQTGFSDHWSPTIIELESAIQHIIDGIHRFGGNNLWDDILQRHIGIVRGHFTRTLQAAMHDQPLQEGISKQQLLVHGLQSFYQHGIENLQYELKSMIQAIVDNQIFAFSVSSVKNNDVNSSGPVNEDYTAALGLFTLLLQLGRLLFHYAQHSTLTERMSFSIQKMSLKLVHIVVTMIEPFVDMPLPGTIHDEVFSKSNSAQNLLAQNNSRYVEFIEVKIAGNFYAAMLYLELRLPHLASKVAREVLQSPFHHTHRGWMKLELRFLHLLCLSVSASDEGDDPKKLALAIALIQKVIGTSVLFGTNDSNSAGHDPNASNNGPPVLPAPIDALHLNERYTILLLILQSGERRLATTVCERLVQDMHILLQRCEYEEAHHQQRAQDPTNNLNASEINTTYNNSSCNSKSMTFSKVPFFITMIPDVAFQNDTIVKMVKLLRQVAQVAVQLDRLTLAKQAVGIAWKTLYIVDAATIARLKKDAENNPPPTTFMATQAAQSQPINTMMNIIQPKSLEQLAKTHEEIDALRYLPTLLGWRLPEGYGWGLEHHRDLEAALLCTCARIIQQETGKIDDPRAISLLHLALSHDANHVETLNALANVSLALYERDILRKGNPTLSMDYLNLGPTEGEEVGNFTSPNNDKASLSNNNERFYVKEETLLRNPDANNNDNKCDMVEAFMLQTHDQDLLDLESSYAFLSEHFPQLASPHLASAMFYVRSALAVQERCADSWQLMSAITRALQQGEFSEEAAITALECQVHLPVRRSCAALW